MERDIEIIGEAMNRILKEDRDIAITNSRKIVDARNYIIHGYDSLSADILWSIVTPLPILQGKPKTVSSEYIGGVLRQGTTLDRNRLRHTYIRTRQFANRYRND